MGKVKSHFSLGIPMMGIPRAETLFDDTTSGLCCTTSRSLPIMFTYDNENKKEKEEEPNIIFHFWYHSTQRYRAKSRP